MKYVEGNKYFISIYVLFHHNLKVIKNFEWIFRGIVDFFNCWEFQRIFRNFQEKYLGLLWLFEVAYF